MNNQFSLKWNDHQTTLISAFTTLLTNEALVDCTLSAEGQFINAHKMVLSACSPYFESLLSRHFDKHPIVILRDVKFHELEALMNYMYKGSVQIAEGKLEALLKVAESLQIKGLYINTEEESEEIPSPVKCPQSTPIFRKRMRLDSESTPNEDPATTTSTNPGIEATKEDLSKAESSNHLELSEDAVNSSDDNSNTEDYDDKENMALTEHEPLRSIDNVDPEKCSKIFMCSKCTKSYRLKHSLSRHMKFECGKDPQYSCHLCTRKFKHKYDLTTHIKIRHIGIKKKSLGKTEIDEENVVRKNVY